ncbi:uncharacterized protein LOC127264068 [Andrographis paniculata]|uniref:uncharacterized protein LOC127264068 n=1 Tax=Andrographis paniculata TaxID=175694 RepID=UPI0021E9604F|nr:uncharacterized protein LOC127264068 [Andrographis paniculata]
MAAAGRPPQYSPISERDNEGFSDFENPSSSCLGRLCFWCVDDDADGGGGSSHNRLLHDGAPPHRSSWLGSKLKSLKEHLELAAGPKWKNFIRRIGRLRNSGRAAQFQYSPESYALNFAGGEQREDEGTLLYSFSARFAPHAFVNDRQSTAAGS